MKKQNIDDISIKQMKMFLAVARHKSFSEAAESLFVNQSVISRNIQGMETALSVSLFERKYRGVELTSQGKELYHELRAFVDDYERLVNKVQSNDAWTEDTIVAGVLNLDDTVYLTRNLIRKYTEIHPDVRFDLHDYGMRELHDTIMCDELHVGFSFQLGMGSMPGVKMSHVSMLGSFFCVNTKNAGIRGNTFEPKALENETLILTSVVDFTSPEERAFGVCKRFGFKPKTVRYVQTRQQAQIAVKNGEGFSIDGKSFADRYPEDTAVFPIKGLRHEQYLVSLHKEDCTHKPTLDFLEWIKTSHFQENELR